MQILSVSFRCCFGEIETSRDHCLPVNTHDLVVRNSVLGVDERRYAFVAQKSCRGVLFRALAVSLNHPDAHTPAVKSGLEAADGMGGARTEFSK
jgi:hypothetical protein